MCDYIYLYGLLQVGAKKKDRAQLSVSHYCRWIIGIQLGVRRRWRRDKSLERPKGERAVNHVVNRQTICAVYIYKGISLFRKARNNIRKKILTGIGLGGSYRKRLNESELLLLFCMCTHTGGDLDDYCCNVWSRCQRNVCLLLACFMSTTRRHPSLFSPFSLCVLRDGSRERMLLFRDDR